MSLEFLQHTLSGGGSVLGGGSGDGLASYVLEWASHEPWTIRTGNNNNLPERGESIKDKHWAEMNKGDTYATCAPRNVASTLLFI